MASGKCAIRKGRMLKKAKIHLVGELSASPQKDAILGEKAPFCRKERKDRRSQGRSAQVFKTLINANQR